MYSIHITYTQGCKYAFHLFSRVSLEEKWLLPLKIIYIDFLFEMRTEVKKYQTKWVGQISNSEWRTHYTIGLSVSLKISSVDWSSCARLDNQSSKCIREINKVATHQRGLWSQYLN